MATALASSPQNKTDSLRELIERLPQVLNESTPIAVQLEACASDDAVEHAATAETAFIRSARSFLRPCFEEAVLENLTRDDPVASPLLNKHVTEDMPDQTLERARQLDLVHESARRVHAEQSSLRRFAEQVEEEGMNLEERLANLQLQTEAASAAGLSVLDLLYADVDEDSAKEIDRQNDETLKEAMDAVVEVEERKAALIAEVAAARKEVARQEEELLALEKEQTAAVGLAEADANRRLDASRETENLAGVAALSDEQLHAALEEEETLVQKNSDVSSWYAATVNNVAHIGGVRVSHRLVFGTEAESEVLDGLELMVDIGSGQVMEVVVASADASLRSVRLVASAGGRRTEGGRLTPLDLEELRVMANARHAPGNLRVLVREVLNRASCAALREEHVRLMRRRYLVAYTAPKREVTITMPVGIVACFRLHVDYPKVAFGAEVIALAGVGGWPARDTEKLCRQVNDLKLPTLMDAMDQLERGVVVLSEEGA